MLTAKGDPFETLVDATQKLRRDSPEILVLTDGISRIFDALINRVEDLGILSEEASVELERQMDNLIHSVKNTVHSKGTSALNSTKVVLAEIQKSVEQFLHDKQFPSVEEISRKLVKVSEQVKELVSYVDQQREDEVSDSGSRSGFVDETMKIEFSKFLTGAIGSSNKNFTDSRFAEDDKQQQEISVSVHQDIVKQNAELNSKLSNLESLRKNDQQVIDLQYRCLEVLQNQVRDLMKLHEEMKLKDQAAAASLSNSPESPTYKQHTKSPSKAHLAEKFQSKLEQIGEEMEEIEETNKKIQDIQGLSFDRKLRMSVERDTAEVKISEHEIWRNDEVVTRELQLGEEKSELDEAEMRIRASAPENDIEAIFKQAMKGIGLSDPPRNPKSWANDKKISPQKERLSTNSSNSHSNTENSISIKPSTTPPLNFRKTPGLAKIGAAPPSAIRSVTPRQPVAPQLSPSGTSWDRDAFSASYQPATKVRPPSSTKGPRNGRSTSATSENAPAKTPTGQPTQSLTAMIRKEVKSVKTELNLVTSVVAPKSGERHSSKTLTGTNLTPTTLSQSQSHQIISGMFGGLQRSNSKGSNKPSTSQEKVFRRSSVAKSDDIERKGSSLRGSFNLERSTGRGAANGHFTKSDYYPGGVSASASITSLPKKDNSLSLSNQASASKPPRTPTIDARQNSPKKPIMESTGGNYGIGAEALIRRSSMENISAELRSLKKESLARDVPSSMKMGLKTSAVATSHSSLVKGAAGIASFNKASCQPSTNHVLGKTRQFARSTLEPDSSPQILIHKPRTSPKKNVPKSSLMDSYGFAMRQSHQPDSQAVDRNLLRYIDKLQRENANLRESSVGSTNLEAFKLKTENTHLKDAIMLLTGRDAYEFIRPSATSPAQLRDPLSSEDFDSDLAFLARSERGSATLPSQRMTTEH